MNIHSHVNYPFAILDGWAIGTLSLEFCVRILVNYLPIVHCPCRDLLATRKRPPLAPWAVFPEEAKDSVQLAVFGKVSEIQRAIEWASVLLGVLLVVRSTSHVWACSLALFRIGRWPSAEKGFFLQTFNLKFYSWLQHSWASARLTRTAKDQEWASSGTNGGTAGDIGCKFLHSNLVVISVQCTEQ